MTFKKTILVPTVIFAILTNIPETRREKPRVGISNKMDIAKVRTETNTFI